MGRCVPSRAATRDESLKSTGAQKLIAACQTIPATRALALDLLSSQVNKSALSANDEYNDKGRYGWSHSHNFWRDACVPAEPTKNEGENEKGAELIFIDERFHAVIILIVDLNLFFYYPPK